MSKVKEKEENIVLSEVVGGFYFKNSEEGQPKLLLFDDLEPIEPLRFVCENGVIAHSKLQRKHKK